MTRAIPLALCLTLLASSAPARAQSDTEREAATALADRGAELYQRREWNEALGLFQRAYAVVPAPAFLLFQARCMEKLNKLDEADATYARVEAMAGDPALSAPSRQAVTDAQSERRALRERRAQLGKPAPPVATAPAATSAAPAAPPAPAASGSTRTASNVALGVGAAGLLVGVGAGAVMLSKKSSLDDGCPANRCAADQADTLSSFRTARTVSWVGWGVGLVGVSVGVGLRLFGGAGSTRSGNGAASGGSARLVVGPSFSGVQGSFLAALASPLAPRPRGQQRRAEQRQHAPDRPTTAPRGAPVLVLRVIHRARRPARSADASRPAGPARPAGTRCAARSWLTRDDPGRRG